MHRVLFEVVFPVVCVLELKYKAMTVAALVTCQHVKMIQR